MNKGKEIIKITTLIGQGSVCDGGLSTTGSTRIDGQINGNVTVKGTLILGASGIINGNVKADAVNIGGEVNGNIKAPKKAEITSTAKVIGDIVTDIIIIDENAVFQGNITMTRDVNGKRDKGLDYMKNVRKGRKEAQLIADEAMNSLNAVQNASDDSEEKFEGNGMSDILV